MTQLLSEQLENPILAAARASSSPVPAPGTPTPAVPSPISPTTIIPLTSSSQSITVKTVEVTPNVEGITADSMMEDITRGIEEGTIHAIQKANQIEQQARDKREIGDLIVDNAINVQLLNSVAETAEIDKQLNLHAILNERGAEGGGTGAFVDRSKQLAAEKRVAADNVKTTQLAVEENVNLAFAEDPVNWILNKFTLGGLVEESNVAAASFNRLDALQDNMNAFASGTDQALDKLKVTATHATLAAKNAQIANLAQQQSLKSDIAAGKLQAEATQIAVNRSNAQTAAQIAKWNILQQERTFKVAQQQRDAIIKKAKESDQVLNATIDAYLAGVKVVGGSAYTGTDPDQIAKERDEVKVRLNTKGKLQNDAIDLVALGLGATKPTPSQAYLGVAAYDTDSLINEVDPMKSALTRVASAVDVKAKEEGIKLTRELFETNFNAEFKATMEGFEAEIKPEDKENPNSAPPLSTLIESPALKDLPFVVNVLSNLFNEKTKDLTPIQAMRAGLAAIKTKNNPEGTITFEEYVSGMVAIYSKAADVNTSNQNRENLNLRPQTTYKIKLTDPNFFYNTFNRQSLTGDVIDIMDPTIVRAHALRTLSSTSLTEEQKRSIRSTTPAGNLPDFLDFLDEDK